jgi:phosphatidylglycerophosphate synthase
MTTIRKKSKSESNPDEVLQSITRDRVRTNLFSSMEQPLIAYLVQRIPSRISSDMLTAFGFFGSMVIFASFVLGTYVDRNWLLLAVPGFAINWFGDSLDGRLAFYRNKPRRLYGFTLDITIDWMSIILVGFGYVIYAGGAWELLGYAFVVMYGWEIIIALMRYRITGTYSIDSGKLGPTEGRLIISAILVAEVLFKGTLIYSVLVSSIILFIINIVDTHRLLTVANGLDAENKSA